MDKIQKLIKLFELTGVRKGVEGFVGFLLQETSHVTGKSFDELEKLINIDDVMLVVAEEDKDVFTEEELDAQIAFMSTPIGKSIVKKSHSLSDPEPTVTDYFEAKIRQHFSDDEPS